MTIRPMNDRVLVIREDEAETTASGIIIPDTAKEKPQKGKVVAVGPGKLSKNGVRMALEVSVGDRVLFSKYGGTEIDVDGVTHLVLTEEDILGILE